MSYHKFQIGFMYPLQNLCLKKMIVFLLVSHDAANYRVKDSVVNVSTSATARDILISIEEKVQIKDQADLALSCGRRVLACSEVFQASGQTM